MIYLIISVAFCLVGFAIGYAKGVRDCFDYISEQLEQFKKDQDHDNLR